MAMVELPDCQTSTKDNIKMGKKDFEVFSSEESNVDCKYSSTIYFLIKNGTRDPLL